MQHLVKICGNKEKASSLAVAAAGPDIMGWIFSPKSKRQLAMQDARLQIQAIHMDFPGIQHWGVFAQNSPDEILTIIKEIPEISAVQIVEDATFCTELARRLPVHVSVVPALRVSATIDEKDLQAFGSPPLFVMDAFAEGAYGGTGKRLDPDFLRKLRRPWILAGGLTAKNVAAAIEKAGPFLAGVDVSSGVEDQLPGSKNLKKVQQFIENARKAFLLDRTTRDNAGQNPQ